jgi:inner membrane protease ATP23
MASSNTPSSSSSGSGSSSSGASSSAMDSLHQQLHSNCEKGVETALKQNTTIQKMLAKIESLGCSLPSNIEKTFFSCRSCDITTASSGGLTFPRTGNTGSISNSNTNKPPHIVVCENKCPDQESLETTLIHELVHAYDMCRVKKFSMENCDNVACAEIRASSLSGECSFGHELLRGRMALFAGHRDCVRRRAELSLSGNPRCKVIISFDIGSEKALF